MALPSLREKFLSTFLRRQPFDLPDSIIYYILKNLKSSKVYQKLIQCCKYFFVKNPILVLHCLHVDDDGWKVCSNQTNCNERNFQRVIDTRILSSCCKLWIDFQIRILSTDSNVASDLAPKIYKCDATESGFINQNISLQQFLSFAQKSEICVLSQVIVSSEVCTEIPLEEIVAKMPNILNLFVKNSPESRNVSSNTVKKLLQIPHFKNLAILHVFGVFEEFDIGPIYGHYKKNRTRFTFGVDYRNELSEEFEEKLEEIANEILDYDLQDNENTPFVGYPGQNTFIYNALNDLYRKTKLYR